MRNWMLAILMLVVAGCDYGDDGRSGVFPVDDTAGEQTDLGNPMLPDAENGEDLVVPDEDVAGDITSDEDVTNDHAGDEDITNDVACVPDCTNRECGSDGCGGWCGEGCGDLHCDSGICAVCFEDRHCDEGETCARSERDPMNSNCVPERECNEDDDCRLELACNMAAGVCGLPCGGDACDGDSAIPHCTTEDPEMGRCVECVFDAHCDLGFQCDGETYTCQPAN